MITITGHGMGLPIDFPLTLGLSSIACIPLTWFLTLFFKVYASEQGIRCFDFWGRYHRTPWSAITGERPINLLGLRYLRIDAQDRVTIWLPLYLHRQSAFWEFAGTWWSPGDGDPEHDDRPVGPPSQA
ncbi:MAG: hypothetical protein KDC38_21805, partial [Planctomycetes bacterium]|nr:hypothetical protein [Planctomycetota bacterium]